MDKIWTIKENILYFIEKQCIRKTEFYEKTEITASNFKGVGLKSEIGGDKIVKILSCYPNLSAEWLLTRKEPMLKIDNGDPRNIPEIVNNKDVIERLERENALKDKVISGLERENQLLREARESNQDKSKPSHAVANVTGSK